MNFLVPIATLGGLAIFVGAILALVSRLLKMEKEFRVKITNDGNELTVEWDANLMEALKAAGYGLMASCGGTGVCGTCRVKIIEGLDEPTPAQLGPLKGDLRKEGWVLSCQTQVKDNLVIELFAPLVSSWPEVGETEAEVEVKELSPKAQKIRSKLPGFDCGACGYESCEDYAEALATGEVPPARCIPGGEPVRKEIEGALKQLKVRASS
jgi:ferredoxin